MVLPYFITNIDQCATLLVVASISAALFPLIERIDKKPPDYSGRARFFGMYLLVGPQIGFLLAVLAIVFCLLHAWISTATSCPATRVWLMGVSLVLLSLAIIVFLSVAAIGFAFTIKRPGLADAESVSRSDLERLTGNGS